MKKIVLLLALSLVLAVSACGTSGSSSSESQAPAATVEEAESTAAIESTEATEAAEAAEAEDIKAALIGVWQLDDTEFTFGDSSVTIVNDQFLKGSYELNTADATIEFLLEGLGSGAMTMQMSYEYKDGMLTLKNDEGKELTKKEK